MKKFLITSSSFIFICWTSLVLATISMSPAPTISETVMFTISAFLTIVLILVNIYMLDYHDTPELLAISLTIATIGNAILLTQVLPAVFIVIIMYSIYLLLLLLLTIYSYYNAITARPNLPGM
ncbi:hypothetical protein [Pontibacillus yanchengensis]|uniref:hypothetical protein n=1 Tax=Pontibacillus yanchengensis TaxID=462910 RepID=UPI0012698ECD|nr:hypothetical protein [Pontibacillus yanchengensis]